MPKCSFLTFIPYVNTYHIFTSYLCVDISLFLMCVLFVWIIPIGHCGTTSFKTNVSINMTFYFLHLQSVAVRHKYIGIEQYHALMIHDDEDIAEDAVIQEPSEGLLRISLQ